MKSKLIKVVPVINRIVINTLLIVILSVSSAGIYLFQIMFFKKPGDTFFYLFQDLAFVPVQALVVTLILNKLLNLMERQRNIKKVNVIISAFFSELGTSIVYELSKFNENHGDFCKIIEITELTKKNINEMKKKIEDFDFKVQVTPDNLENLGLILIDKKPFMINMLENASLLEHDSFTDMLWSVFHVADELQSRDNLMLLSKADLDHVRIDILRAYRLITMEWIYYMKYLNAEYPYLFNLAVRKNPFSQKNVR